MKVKDDHGFISLSFVRLLLSVSQQIIISVGAQSESTSGSGESSQYQRFSPPFAIVIAILVTALVFITLFAIYIIYCSSASSTNTVVVPRYAAAGKARGLDQSVIEANFPTFSYSEVKDHKIGKGTLECAVCLNEFEDDYETLRLIPICDHVFHPVCIDAWLEYHVTCPVCRANLDPEFDQQSGQDPDPDPYLNQVEINDVEVEIDNSRINNEVEIQIDNETRGQELQVVKRDLSFENRNRKRSPRSRARNFGFGKFRSHSTGHSLVLPGENLERFTLKLPSEVRKKMMERTRSFAPGEGSSRKEYKSSGGGEGSSRAGRFYRRIGWFDREVKSDRWASFKRGLSFNLMSPKVMGDAGEGSVSSSVSKSGGGSRTPVKMLSFKCLEPSSSDHIGLVSNETTRPPS